MRIRRLLPFSVLLSLVCCASCLRVVVTPEPSQDKCKQGAALFVLAGGGAEGDIGDTSAWSFALYGRLLENGDTNGDGVVRVSILATEGSSDPTFLPSYFVWLGETRSLLVEAENLLVPTRKEAQQKELAEKIARSDVVFLKGGDQGVYYDEWNDTPLEAALRTVASCNGAIGGTSAGAMSLSQYSFSGGRDLISEDVLADAHTPFLDDDNEPGTSGIHDDFLGFVSGTLVDTHYTARGRMGRLLGIMAKASEDFGRPDLLSIGLEERTGLVVQNNTAEVIGVGEVSFLQESADTQSERAPGAPLHYTSLRLDRLTHGWRYDLKGKKPITKDLPKGAEAIVPPGHTAPTQNSALLVRGDVEADRSKFSLVADFFPQNYRLVESTQTSVLEGSVGFTDCGETDHRMDKQETLFRALYDRPGTWGFFVFLGGALQRDAAVLGLVSFISSPRPPAMSGIVIDSSEVSHRGLSPFTSNWATDGGSLRAAALLDLRVHVVAPGHSLQMTDGSVL